MRGTTCLNCSATMDKMGCVLFQKKLLGRMKKKLSKSQHHHKNGLFGLAAGRMAGVKMLLSVDAGLLNELAQGLLAPAVVVCPAVAELLLKNPLSAAANGDVAAATTWFPLFCWFSWKSLNEANPATSKFRYWSEKQKAPRHSTVKLHIRGPL